MENYLKSTEYYLDYQEKIIKKIRKLSDDRPEIIFEWNDRESEAKGYLVINSLKRNAAGGGTRVHKDITLEEIISLAKTMEIKFLASETMIGGAKSGIRMDYNHPKKQEILYRWCKAIKPYLQSHYGTGGDLNVSFNEIESILLQFGINSPQEGIINALYEGDEFSQNQAKINIAKLSSRKIKIGVGYFNITDLITGYGVAMSIAECYRQKGKPIQDRTVYIQGVGNVGAAAAYFLHKLGCRIVALNDVECGLINRLGIDEEHLIKLLETHNVALTFNKDILQPDDFNKNLSKINIEIFIPSAKSKIITKEYIINLINNGLEIISCGANNPFIETDYIYGECSQYIDRKIALVPDILSSLGMARLFHLLIHAKDEILSDDEIFNDIKQVITKNIERACAVNNCKLLTASIYELLL